MLHMFEQKPFNAADLWMDRQLQGQRKQRWCLILDVLQHKAKMPQKITSSPLFNEMMTDSDDKYYNSVWWVYNVDRCLMYSHLQQMK